MAQNPAVGRAPARPTQRILLVEDDIELSGAIGDVLRAGGCVVDTATTAGDALRCVLGGNYHAVIAEADPPRIDGVELARLLSRRVQSPHIVLMTASSDPEAIREGYAAGASHVLSKPLSLTLLGRLVQNLIAF